MTISGCSHTLSGDYITEAGGTYKLHFDKDGYYDAFKYDHHVTNGFYHWDEEDKCYYLGSDLSDSWDVIKLEPQFDGRLKAGPSYFIFVKQGTIWSSPLMILIYIVLFVLLMITMLVILIASKRKKKVAVHKNATVPEISNTVIEGNKFCTKCRTKCSPNQNFCKKCGSKLGN